MKREELKKLAEKTINISKNKSYNIGDEIIHFDIERELLKGNSLFCFPLVHLVKTPLVFSLYL